MEDTTMLSTSKGLFDSDPNLVSERVKEEPGEMFTPGTDVVSQSPHSGTESLSSASLNQATFWHPTEGLHMEEVHRVVSDFLGLSTKGEGVVKQEVTQDEQYFTRENTSAVPNTPDEDQNVGYHLQTRTSQRIIDSQSSSSSESDDESYKVIKKQRQQHYNKLKTVDKICVSEQLGVSKEVDNSGIDIHWVKNWSMFKCNICQKLYERLDRMREHIRTHLGVKPFACTVEGCKGAFNAFSQLHRHVREVHMPPTFECFQCNKKFVNKILLKHHISSAHNNVGPRKCKHCDNTFTDNRAYIQHLKTVHEIRRKCKGQCDICGLMIYDSSVKYHKELVHYKTITFRCKVCKAQFVKMNDRENHMIVHKNDRIKCESCSKTFTNRKKLYIHTKTHLRSFECNVCAKVFKSKLFLEGHLLQHNGIRKHCCNVCGKTFVHKHYLHTHMKSHGEKKFICDLCGGKFNRKDNLKSHIIRHMQAERKKGKSLG